MSAQAAAVAKYFRARELVVRLESELATFQDLRHRAKVMVEYGLDETGSWANDFEKVAPVIAEKETKLRFAEEAFHEAFVEAAKAGVAL